jgi:hypothetical protein
MTNIMFIDHITSNAECPWTLEIHQNVRYVISVASFLKSILWNRGGWALTPAISRLSAFHCFFVPAFVTSPNPLWNYTYSTLSSTSSSASVGLHRNDLPRIVVVQLLALDATKMVYPLAELTVVVEEPRATLELGDGVVSGPT